MSKAYRIKISGIELNLHLDRSITLDIDLLPILGREAMLRLLLEQLKQAGFTEQPNGLWNMQKQLSEWVFDPATLKLEVRPLDVQKLDELEISVYDDWLDRDFLVRHHGDETVEMSEAQARGHEAIQQALDERIRRLTGEQQEISQRFFDEVLQARQLINSSLKEVYRQAVQEKARSLGNVVSVSEQEQGGELRIRLEVEG